MSSPARPINPVIITTLDGQERKLLLSMGAIRRVKQQLGVKTLKEIMDRDIVDAGVPMLWEALLDKDGLTIEEFENIIPADIQAVTKIILALIGVSFTPPENPMPAAPEAEPQATVN